MPPFNPELTAALAVVRRVRSGSRPPPPDPPEPELGPGLHRAVQKAFSLRKYGKTAIAWLDELGVLGDNVALGTRSG